MRTQSDVLEEILNKIEVQKKNVESVFYYQSEDQLLVKKTPEKWNALQCFEHLNLSNEHYIREICKVLPSVKSSSNKAFKSGVIGAYMTKSMKLKDGEVSNPMKTFKNVRPHSEVIEGNIAKAQPIFTDFFADLAEYKNITNSLKGKDIQSLKIKSLIGSVVKFKVGDALLFMMAHNERHIQQALNALKEA